MRKAIVTFAKGKAHERISSETQGQLKKYAKKIDADFLFARPFNAGVFPIPHYYKIKCIKDALERYDRVLWVDADILVSDLAPDIFEAVPLGKLGIFNEAPWIDRLEAIRSWESLTGFAWPDETKYYNTGVIVADQTHKVIFSDTPKPMVQHFGEQTWLNQKIFEAEAEVFELSHDFNRMSCTWRKGQDPYSSHFIHFAGFPSDSLPEFIRERLKEWKDHKFVGGSQILIVTGGGMGNQIATCPTIEAIAKAHPASSIGIHTFYPEAFRHLKNEYPLIEVIQIERDPGLTEEEQVAAEEKKLQKYQFARVISTINPDLPVSMTEMNSVDYHSIAALGRQLTDRSIKIYETKKPYCTLPPNTVVIHAGYSGWPTKDVPVELYQGILDELKSLGLPVALIGKSIQKEHGPGYGAHKLKGADFDLMDEPFPAMMHALRNCQMLISNDSMPVHAAGATDCYIAVISIAKKPQLIFPYRFSSISYKTVSLTAPTGKNLWDLRPAKAFYFPNDPQPNVATWVDGMEWPDKNYIMMHLRPLLKGAT